MRLPLLRILAGSSVVALLAAGSPAVMSQSPRRFALAVIRRDGRLLPFAAYDEGRWRNRWPTVLPRFEDVPLTLARIPASWWPWREPLLTWTVWPIDGSRREVTVRGPVHFNSSCSRALGLSTDYQPFAGALPPARDPYPKDGLATAGNVMIEPVETLTAASKDWAMVGSAVGDDANDAEDQMVQAWSGEWKHPVGRAKRAAAPLTLEVLCRAPGTVPGSRVYYFEGVKRYKQEPGWKTKIDKKCDFLTFLAGWLVVDAQNHGKATVTAELTNCGRDGLAYTLPLGSIRLDGRVLWVIQVSGRNYEHYEVLEPRPGSVRRLIATVGGSCR